MRFAQFWKPSTGYVAGSIPPRFEAEAVRPIEACGSDGVLPIDGRLSLANAASLARDMCKRRGFIGFTIEQGASFSRSHVVRQLELV